MEISTVPEASMVAKVLQYLSTSEGFLILGGSIVMIALTQLIKFAIVYFKKQELSGGAKKLLSALSLFIITAVVGLILGIDLKSEGTKLLSMASVIGYVSTFLYRFGFSYLFEKMEFTDSKAIEIATTVPEPLG